MYRLQAVEDSVDNLTSRGLLSAVATLAALTDVRGIIYYCDDPDLPNPLGRQAPPTEFTEGEQLLGDILVQLTAEREVFRWYGDPFIAPESLVLAQRLVEETVAGYSAKQEEFENRFAE